MALDDTILGRHEIRAHISAGGMGQAWMGQNI